jgi:hypothetical protein
MPDTPPARLLVETVARALYLKSLQRDTWDIDDADEKWKTAKARFAERPYLYTRPAHAFEDAKIAIAAILDAIAEPSDAMLTAALATSIYWINPQASLLDINKTKMNTWYRAMIAALRKEIELPS